MAGEGVMSHMIASLKMNKRSRVRIFEQDSSFTIYTTPIVLKETSADYKLSIKQEVERLQRLEKIRRSIAITVTLGIFVIIIIKLL
jgi:uncharacterized membrane protein